MPSRCPLGSQVMCVHLHRHVCFGPEPRQDSSALWKCRRRGGREAGRSSGAPGMSRPKRKGCWLKTEGWTGRVSPHPCFSGPECPACGVLRADATFPPGRGGLAWLRLLPAGDPAQSTAASPASSDQQDASRCQFHTCSWFTCLWKTPQGVLSRAALWRCACLPIQLAPRQGPSCSAQKPAGGGDAAACLPAMECSSHCLACSSSLHV